MTDIMVFYLANVNIDSNSLNSDLKMGASMVQ